MDKIELIGNDKGGLYLFDRDLEKLSSVTNNGPA
jgi:ferritin